MLATMRFTFMSNQPSRCGGVVERVTSMRFAFEFWQGSVRRVEQRLGTSARLPVGNEGEMFGAGRDRGAITVQVDGYGSVVIDPRHFAIHRDRIAFNEFRRHDVFLPRGSNHRRDRKAI